MELPNGQKLTLVKVEVGTFEMSAKDGQNESTEVPHMVTLTRDFYLGRTEVTQAQWKAVMGTNPSSFKGDDLPVETVSWNDAMEFCEKLNAMGKAPSGWKFSLPTETQWEYAARGGKRGRGCKYSGSNSIDDVAWYYVNSGDSVMKESTRNSDRLKRNNCRPHPVGQKVPNELGLYDMSGNVSEMCLDETFSYGISNVNPSNQQKAEFTVTYTNSVDRTGRYRIIRGGYWGNRSEDCRCAVRSPIGNILTSSSYGFRLALVPESY